jgi:hypothetical protein
MKINSRDLRKIQGNKLKLSRFSQSILSIFCLSFFFGKKETERQENEEEKNGAYAPSVARDAVRLAEGLFLFLRFLLYLDFF